MPALPSTRSKKRVYHQTFAIKDDGGGEVVRHTLLVNPEDMSFGEPGKTTVTETLGGGYVADFGSAFKSVTLQGITGYNARKNKEGEERDGFTEFMHFRNEVYRKFIESADPQLSMYWYNWEDDDYWRIQPTNFRLLRNKNEPLLYRYEFTFTLLEQLDAGNTTKDSQAKKPIVNMIDTGKKLSTNISILNELRSKLKR